MLAQLGHILVGVSDSVLVGRLGKVPLAAVGLGVSSSTLLLVLGLGLSMGTVPLVAAAQGREDYPALGRLLVATVGLNTLAGLVLVGLGQLLPMLLHLLGQPPAVVALATPWVRVVSWSLLPLMVFQGFREYAEGLGLTRQAMWLSVLANVVNVALCYLLIFGHWGLPALGMVGSAWATLFARVLMAALMAAYVLRAKRLAPHRAAAPIWGSWDGPIVRRLLALGAPIGLQMAFEMGAFSVANFMMGWIGITAQAAHQVAITVAATTYMAASGIATAATVRVGQFVGQGQMGEARRAGFAAYWLVLGFMGGMGLVLVFSRHWLPTLFIDDPAVQAQAAALLLVAAAFQVFDGLQVVGLGALRGLEDVKVPSVVALLAYWAVALPLAYGLGFVFHQGAVGIWVALLLGLAIVAGVLLRRFGREAVPGFVPPDPELVLN